MKKKPESYRSGVERRRHERIKSDMALKFRLVDENGAPLDDACSDGRVIDISESGMRVAVDREIRPGQRLEISGTSEHLSTGVHGCVTTVHVTPRGDGFEVGVEFEQFRRGR